MRNSNKLTALFVAKTTKPGRYADGGNLYLQIAQGGTKSWLFRYMVDGKARTMGLGSVDIVSLSDAREKAHGQRRLLLDRIDPLKSRQDEKHRQRLEMANSKTFKQCAEEFLDANEANWKNAKHSAQWRSTLARYVYPIFGDVAVASVDTGMILKVLDGIWNEKPETASRLRGRIERILSWATPRGYRSGENPARWQGHLKEALGGRVKRVVRNFPALAFNEIPTFMPLLRSRDGIGARALEFLILTGLRTSEVIGAKWDEIDFDKRVWTAPGWRMKNGRTHRVPLSEGAVRVLQSIPKLSDENSFVFFGVKKGRSISTGTMDSVLSKMKRNDITVHGFRSTFRDWAAETTNHQNHVVEMALSHVQLNKVEAAYRRGDLLEMRRPLMNDWNSYCQRGTVVSLARAG
jgi:integrase